jgi:hypothetical protein
VWHELVLNGIGGHTIAQAQESISAVEFAKWMAYRRKRGSLNVGLRVEAGSAMTASLTANLNRKKDSQAISFYDFAPNHDRPQMSLEEAMETWQ